MLTYSFILVLMLALELGIIAKRSGGRFTYHLNAGLVLVTSFFAYTVSLPFSRLVLGTRPLVDSTELSFMFHSLLAALGLAFGLLAYPRSTPAARAHANSWRTMSLLARSTIRRGLMVPTVTLAVGAGCVYFLSHAQFSIDTLAGAYNAQGGQNDITTENVTVLDTLLIPLAIVAALHGMYAIKVRALRGLGALVINVLCLGLLGMFLIQGHRNLMIFLGLSVLGLKQHGRPIRLATFAVAAILAIVAAYSIGIVRNWGWLQLDQVIVSSEAMDPLNGELGAPFSVFAKYQEIGTTGSLRFGGTYVTDTAINLVPQQIWRNRPSSPAVTFSQAYFGTTNLSSGLGFSPLVESILNFSSYGVIFVFAVTAMIFVWLDEWARTRGRVGTLISCALLPSIVNWNRIDFAACCKMFLVYAAFIWILDKIFYSSVAAKSPLGRSNELASAPRLTLERVFMARDAF